jgi:succinate dehydrogenase/fumarate reductase flavoprotein subunit
MMAYKAGADLQNLEFSTRQISLRFGPWSGKGTWVGILRDSEGNAIAPPYLAEPDAEISEPAIGNANAFDHVWATGKGPVWMDPRGISEEDERYMRWGLESEAMTPFFRWLDREKIEIRKTRFEFIPMQPTISVQVRVDTNLMTRVHGLYAIIRRGLSGNAGGLSGSAVGGMIAGEAAAKYAEDIELSDLKEHHTKILRLKHRYEELLNREGLQFADWREVQWAIWQIMHTYALPPRRTHNTLMAGQNHLLRIRDRAHRILKAENQHDLYHCLEVMNLMDIAELVFLSVNKRKESRGQARRQDYPFTNPMLNKFLVVTQRDGKPTFRWEIPRGFSREP